MLIAGEASGDTLAAELVSALRGASAANPQSEFRNPQFIGAGGPKMAAAGVDLAFDLTQHSVIGVSDVLKNLLTYRRLFNQLLALAIERKPDAIIGVDYGGFNLRFGHAVKQYVRDNPFSKWNPKIIQFVSPQVWASRPGRAKLLAADYDLLLSIFPFEQAWYAKRVPNLRVEFVGHPMIERYATIQSEFPLSSILHPPARQSEAETAPSSPTLLLLPGSRNSELQRHLPVMLDTVELIQRKLPACRTQMVLPNPALKALAEKLCTPPPVVEIQVGNLPQALMQADVAIASTGTVTMECAFFSVPAVTLYKTSWLTYQIAKHIVTVKSLTMPNLLANDEVYPEFVQNAATPGNIAGAALELLQNEPRRARIKKRLAEVVATLGGPGATTRAAQAILSLFA
jgi:lipid-A-disaccharide synthase